MSKPYRLEKNSVQWQFNQSRNRIQIFGGAYANGKTSAACIKGLQLAKDYPGSNGLIARATYPKLNDTIRKSFLDDWCPSTWIKRRPTNDDNTCILHNGTTINFRYVAQKGKSKEDGQTSSNLLSATYDWMIIDQVEDPEISHKDFMDLIGRLRGSTPYRGDDPTMPMEGPQWFILTANPSYGWFYRKVVMPYKIYMETGKRTNDLLIDEETGLPIIDLFEADVFSNESNLSKGFINSLLTTHKGQARDRYVKGLWAAYEGLVHPGFNRLTHMITRDKAMAYIEDCRRRHVKLRVLEGYDFGLISPSCYMLAVVDDFGRVIIIDGYYKPEFDYMEQPDEIHRIRSTYIHQLLFRDRINADPAIFKKIAVAGQSVSSDTIAKAFNDAKIFVQASDNSVLTGIAKVNAYINGHPKVPHLVTGDKPSPMLYVVDDLQWFEDEITAYYWKKNPQGENIDEPIDRNDHAMNTVKYMLTKLPDVAKIVIPSEALPPKWKFWHEENA